jgi:5-methylcytosine-specific restriction protein B
MSEEAYLKKHEEILNYLLDYRKQHPEFIFSPRQNHNDLENNHLNCRLCKGYWFQGSSDYIFVALYKRGCKDNKTKTIGFVFTGDRQYIEIVFKRVDGMTDDELNLYDELIAYLRNSNRIRSVEEKNEKKLFFILNSENLTDNLNFFITDVKQTTDELIKKYHLESNYFISENEFEARINEISRIKKIADRSIPTLSNNMESKNMKSSLKTKNIILYGSPGVGKTHNTNKLIGLIEQGKSEIEIFKAIRDNTKETIVLTEDLKHRVSFVTFHQSFGYEDFIEGFRPNENGNIERIDGIFKSICKKAQENLNDSKKNIDLLKLEQTNKDVLAQFIEHLSLMTETIRITENVYLNDIDDKAFYYTSDSGKMTNVRVPFTDLQECINKEIESLDQIRDLESISGTSRQRPTYISKLYNMFKEFKSTNTVAPILKAERVEEENFYLVIDEINRGNISKIFGELITLIEENKRDILEVVLPYSKVPFTVPSNLYIIGTMNSTDKSIALIDIALRRRFTFLKMEPNAQLIPEIASKVFNDLNKYITETLGKEYQIGHSYFMDIQNEDDLNFVIEYKVVPLLEEYYYGDQDGLENAKNICF